MAATVTGILLTGVHGSRPSSGVSAGTLYSCTTHNLIYQTSDTGSTWATWATLGTAASGSITSSGYTQNTAKLLGRTTASSGAIEEITVGSGLTLSAGSLTASAGSLTNAQTFLTSADVTMTTANTFYDGPSTGTLAAGTYLIMAEAIVLNNSGGGQRETFKIWDGTTAYAAGQESSGGSSLYNHIQLSAIVTASGSQAFKMSIAGNGGTQVMQKTPDTNNTGLTNLGTSITYIKIA